jgi:hypothetical protein
MDFLEDLFDRDRRKHKKSGGFFQNDNHDRYGDHEDHHDDHERHHDEHAEHHTHREGAENAYHFPQTIPPPSNTGVSCPQCSNPVMPNTRFCQNCGAALNVNIECKSCGCPIQATAKFCPACGNKLT